MKNKNLIEEVDEVEVLLGMSNLNISFRNLFEILVDGRFLFANFLEILHT